MVGGIVSFGVWATPGRATPGNFKVAGATPGIFLNPGNGNQSIPELLFLNVSPPQAPLHAISSSLLTILYRNLIELKGIYSSHLEATPGRATPGNLRLLGATPGIPNFPGV